MPESIASMKQKAKAIDADGFDNWSTSPEIKMLMSLLPPCENETQKDVLRTLLKSAFVAGADIGRGGLASMILAGIVEKME